MNRWEQWLWYNIAVNENRVRNLLRMGYIRQLRNLLYFSTYELVAIGIPITVAGLLSAYKKKNILPKYIKNMSYFKRKWRWSKPTPFK